MDLCLEEACKLVWRSIESEEETQTYSQAPLEVIAALRSCARSLQRSLVDLTSPWVKKTRNEIHWNRQDNRLVIFGGHLNQAL